MLASLFLLALAAPPPNSPCVAHPDPAGNLVSVYGQILGPNHAVVSLAHIQLKPDGGEPTLHDFADRDGCFEILVKPGKFDLQIEPSLDFGAMHKSIVVEANQTNPFDVLLNLPTYCLDDCGPTLSSSLKPLATQSDPQGFVPQFHTARICFIDQQGLPVDHIQFMLERISTPNYQLTYTSHVQPAPQGNPMYGCRDIPEVLGGEFHLSADAPGFLHLQQTLQVNSSDAQTVHMTQLLPSASTPPLCPGPPSAPNGLVYIHGQVTDVNGFGLNTNVSDPGPGTDVIGFGYVYVLMQLKSADAPARYLHTGDRGCFQILTKPGNYTLSVTAPGFMLASQNVAAELGKENNYHVVLNINDESGPFIVVPAGTPPSPLSRICFVDQDRLPIEGVQFTLESTGIRKRIFTSSNPAYDNSATWGCEFVNNAPLGNYTVHATAPNYQPLQKNLKIDQPRITIQMTPLPAPTQP